MNEVVAIFLVAPLVVVPLGYRLLAVAAPGYAPLAVTRIGMVVAGALLALSFLFPTGLAAPACARLGDDGCAELRRLVRDTSKQIVAAGDFGVAALRAAAE